MSLLTNVLMTSLIKELKAPVKNNNNNKSPDQTPDDPEDREQLDIEVCGVYYLLHQGHRSRSGQSGYSRTSLGAHQTFKSSILL